MKNTLLLIVAALSVSACAVIPLGSRNTGSSKSSLNSSSNQCKPSQYWDGAMCRHKGKGHGARKHDG